MIKNVLSAIDQRPTAAPIARPSPKLCNPMPIAIINPIATGFDIFKESAFSVSLSEVQYNPRNDKTIVVAISKTPLKLPLRFSTETSNASSTESIPRKSKRPVVKVKEMIFAFTNFFNKR